MANWYDEGMSRNNHHRLGPDAVGEVRRFDRCGFGIDWMKSRGFSSLLVVGSRRHASMLRSIHDSFVDYGPCVDMRANDPMGNRRALAGLSAASGEPVIVEGHDAVLSGVASSARRISLLRDLCGIISRDRLFVMTEVIDDDSLSLIGGERNLYDAIVSAGELSPIYSELVFGGGLGAGVPSGRPFLGVLTGAGDRARRKNQHV
jgi:hypothetical protein